MVGPISRPQEATKASGAAVSDGSEKKEVSFQEQYARVKLEDQIRGGTPPDLAERCLHLCQTYIGGSWAAATLADIQVVRITGGLTNQLYRIELLSHVPAVANFIYPDEPRVVALKLYQAKLMPNAHREDVDERLCDTITLTILSELGVCPRVYGLFSGGIVQDYYEHEQFAPKHQQNSATLRKLAYALARTHLAKVPVRKNHHRWMCDMIKSALWEAYSDPKVVGVFEELKLEYIGKRDLRDEYADMLLAVIEPLERAPLVFSHNDLRRGNILVTKDKEEVKFVDFEYSSYGYRGWDLATFILEWGRGKHDAIRIPTDDTIEHVVRLYIESCERLRPGYSKQPENALEQIVREVKLCMTFNFMFLACFMLRQKASFIEAIPFDLKANLRFVDSIFKSYYMFKEKLVQDGTIRM